MVTPPLCLQDGIGDANDNWRVEVVGGAEGDRIKTVSTLLRLRHANIGCYLYTHSTQLPKWWVYSVVLPSVAA